MEGKLEMNVKSAREYRLLNGTKVDDGMESFKNLEKSGGFQI